MSRPVVALCRWEDYDYGRLPGQLSFRYRPRDDEETTECRATLGDKVLTVWLPQGAKVRMRLSRVGADPLRDVYHHYYGSHERESRRRIRITLWGLPPLVQETVPRDLHYPWRVLVCCALLNQTQGAQVRPMVAELFARCPTPEAMLVADLADLLRPLGLQARRQALLRRLTWDYLAGRPWAECHGAGQYASDALDAFCRGRLGFAPADRWLAPYIEWRTRTGAPRMSWDRRGHRAWRKSLGFVAEK